MTRARRHSCNSHNYRVYNHNLNFKTFYRSYWNIFDFCILIAATCDIILDFCDTFTTFNKAQYRASTVTLITKLIRVIRLVRIFRLCKAWYPKLLKYCDSKIDYHMAFAYDVGKVRKIIKFVCNKRYISRNFFYLYMVFYLTWELPKT